MTGMDPRGLVDKPREPTKVGDTVYRFDINNRVYREPGRFGGGGPIYAKHFVPHKITGEVSKSWALQVGGYATSVGKRTLLDEGPAKAWFTEAQMQDNIWSHDHLHRIKTALDRATVAQLRQVADVIGYDPTQATD